MATTKRERQKAARRQKLEQMQKAAKRRQNTRRAVIVAIVAVLVLGTGALLFSGSKSTTTTTSTSPTSSTSTTSTTTTAPAAVKAAQAKANAIAVAAGCPGTTSARANTITFKTAPALTIDKAKSYYAHFVTTAGTFVVKLDPATAPVTTNSFVFLAEHNFFHCVIFHRVIPGFVIQGGDPTGLSTGGPGYSFKDELPKAGSPTYPLYSVAMANSGANTNGSQFFIVTGTQGEGLPDSYSLFGQVISGQSVVKAINDAGSATGVPPTVTHRMLSVTITNQ